MYEMPFKLLFIPVIYPCARGGQVRNEGVRLRWRIMVGDEAVLVLFLFLTILLHF